MRNKSAKKKSAKASSSARKLKDTCKENFDTLNFVASSKVDHKLDNVEDVPVTDKVQTIVNTFNIHTDIQESLADKSLEVREALQVESNVLKRRTRSESPQDELDSKRIKIEVEAECELPTVSTVNAEQDKPQTTFRPIKSSEWVEDRKQESQIAFQPFVPFCTLSNSTSPEMLSVVDLETCKSASPDGVPDTSTSTSPKKFMNNIEKVAGCLDLVWPDIGAKDGLGFVQPVVADNTHSMTFMSPNMDYKARLYCDESLDSPSLQSIRVVDGSHRVTTIDPIMSSPVINFAAVQEHTKKEPCFIRDTYIFDDDLDIFGDAGGSAQEVSLLDEEDVEDYTAYFMVRAKRPKDSKKPERKWLTFICSTVDTNRKSRDGLVSPHENLRNGMRTPTSPTEEQFLSKLASEFAEEGCITRDLLECWQECSNYFTVPSHQKIHHNLKFRAVIVGWIMESSVELKFQRQTTQCAINCLDRFYARTESFPTNMHQVLAAVALYISAKKDEDQCPQISKMLIVAAAPGLTAAQFRAICIKMMEVLNWELTPPTYMDWICLFLRIAVLINPKLFKPLATARTLRKPHPNHPQSIELGRHIRADLFREAIGMIDLYMHLCESVRFEPSRVAACAFWITCKVRISHVLSEEEIADTVKQCTGYNLSDFDGMEGMTYLHSQKECFPLGVLDAEVEEYVDVDYYQPFYPDLPMFLTSTDNVPLHEDEDVGLLNFGVM